MATILIAEDDHAISDLVAYNLERAGHVPLAAYDGLTALEVARRDKPDLILLDQMMPRMDGHGVLRELRRDSRTQGIPVIFLTAKAQAEDRIQGLELGADDYVTKPFGMGELMARMRVCLRRAGNKEGEPILTCGGLQLNLLEHRVVVEGREVKLTPTEYELLKVMLKYAGRVLTHKQLLKAVWGNEYDTDTHYIRIYMRQLRRKIEPDPAQPKYLITEAGIGYRLLGGE